MGDSRVSRNGRWLVYWSPGNLLSTRMGTWLVDVAGGAEKSVSDLPAAVAAAVAADGSVLLPTSIDLRLITPDGVVKPLKRFPVAAADIDDTHSTVAYESATKRVFAIDVKSGAEWQIGPDDRDSGKPVLAADGSALIYLTQLGSSWQVMYSSRDGSAWRQLTEAPEGVTEATLSGDGRIAYASTNTGRLLSIATNTGMIQELIGPSPALESYSGAAVPGSTNILYGTSLPESPVRISIEGHDCFVLAATPSSLTYQIPWDLPVDSAVPKYSSLGLDFGNTQFEGALEITLARINPKPVILDPNAAYPGGIAIHADFNSLVTVTNPARPGEVVHIYATGLGPVEPQVATGAAGPFDPLSRLAAPIQFLVENGTPNPPPAEVSFAGLAPGVIGYYQIDLRVPERATFPSLSLLTRYLDSTMIFMSIPVGAPE